MSFLIYNIVSTVMAEMRDRKIILQQTEEFNKARFLRRKNHLFENL